MRKFPLAIGLALLGTTVILSACTPSHRTFEQSNPRTQYVQTSLSPGHGSFANQPSQMSQYAPQGHGQMTGHGTGFGQTSYMQNPYQQQGFGNTRAQSFQSQGCGQFQNQGGGYGQQGAYGGAGFGGGQACSQPRFVQTGPTYQTNMYGTPGVVFTQGGYRRANNF